MVQPLHIKNAHIWDGKGTVQRDLYTTDVVVDKPANGAHVVDLDGYTIFPGLINAHDHLELNHYPRSKFRDKYDNAHQWGEDMNARLDTEPYKSLRAYPLWDKLFIGGLKNLLCGATTVAHHNPPHKELWHKDFPVRVLRKYGWTHSLHFSTDAEIVESYRKTPKDVPWFIHLAEGTDDVAAGEYQRLKALGCLGENTIIIHGVNLPPEALKTPDFYYLNWVICPSTNKYLLGKTFLDKPEPFGDNYYLELVLGSDSRLTADGDLLDEIRILNEAFQKTFPEWFTMFGDGDYPLYIEHYVVQIAIGEWAWRITKQWGRQKKTQFADFIAILDSGNPALALCNSRRADLALVVKGGIPQIGDPDVMAKFPHIQTVAATLDGKPKRIQLDLARRIHQNKLKEPRLELDELPKHKFRVW
jgi:hypothetical protein